VHDIKGKIFGDTGLIYPKIMIQDNIDEVLGDLRQEHKHIV